LLWAFFILSASVLATPKVEGVKLFPHADKIVHFILYGILTFLMITYRKEKFVDESKLIVLITFFWGFTIELLQHYCTINRQFELLDLGANILGIIFVVVLLNKMKYNLT
jgi:VanZ family protein